MRKAAPDEGLTVGMTVAFPRLDLEAAVAEVRSAGFEAVEVHLSQLGPGLPGVPVFERHAETAGDLIRRAGLVVSTLNAVADASFDPYGGAAAREATVQGLAHQLRLAAAMGAPRLLIYEGRVADAAAVRAACETLASCLDRAARASRLADPPVVSVECHPFTFGLQHRRLGELGAALRSVGAGICLDFCHFGVALGAELVHWVDDDVRTALNHVHYADTDCVTSELHFPPGDGVLDLEAIGRRLAGSDVAIAWDLFGWPSPRQAMRDRMGVYQAFVTSHAAERGV